MDDLTRSLREDAANIRVTVTPELEERLRASLDRAAADGRPAKKRRQPALKLWWASSLTGVAAAAALIAVLNVTREDPAPPADLTVADVVEPLEMPLLRARKAVMTTPLRDELDNLESDLRKARNALREDMGIARRDD